MAKTITITFKDQASYDKLVVDYCKAKNYQIAIRDPKSPPQAPRQIPNPTTPEAFFQNAVVGDIMSVIVADQARDAHLAAQAASLETLKAAKADITIA